MSSKKPSQVYFKKTAAGIEVLCDGESFGMLGGPGGPGDSLVYNGDGTFTHTAVNGAVVTVDICQAILDGACSGGGSGTDDQQLLPMQFANGQLTVSLEDGGTQSIDLSGIDTDTFVTFAVNPDGTITFTSADGSTQVTTQLDTDTFGTLVDNGDGTWTWTPADGGPAVTIADTDTFSNLVDNGDGSYTWTSADGTQTITIPAPPVDTDTFVEFAQNPDGSVTFTSADGLTTVTIADTDTFATVENAVAGGTDSFGNTFPVGSQVITFPDGQTLCVSKAIPQDQDTVVEFDQTVDPNTLEPILDGSEVYDVTADPGPANAHTTEGVSVIKEVYANGELLSIASDGGAPVNFFIPTPKVYQASANPCNATTVVDNGDGTCTIETLPPREECNYIDVCIPSAPVTPDASSLALFAAPYRGGDRVTEVYRGGSWVWNYDCSGMVWRSTFKPRQESKKWCVVPEMIPGSIPNNPFPPTPDLITVDANGAYDPAGTPIEVVCPISGTRYPLDQAPIQPGDHLTVHFSNGFINYMMGSGCLWGTCGAFEVVIPAISKGTADFSADPLSVSINSIKGDPNQHFVIGRIVDNFGNFVAFADQNAGGQAVQYPAGTMTFTGVTLEPGQFIIAEIVDSANAYDAAGNLNAGVNVLAKDECKIQIFRPACPDQNGDLQALPCLADGSGFDFSQGPFMTTEDGGLTPGVVIQDQADLDAWLAASDKAFASFTSINGDCYYAGVTPVGSELCPALLGMTKVKACIKLITDPIDSCGRQNSGTYNADGMLCLLAEPTVSESNVFEQKVQVSNDGGASWVNPSSFQSPNGSLESWFAADPGSQATVKIDTELQAGSLIRNCLRVIGTTDEFCDEKVIPDPQIAKAAGTMSFSNGSAASEMNLCYDQALDQYSITLNCYDLDGNFLAEYTVPAYTPATAAPDLSGLPAAMVGKVSAGADNFSLAIDESTGTVEAILSIQHTYDCPGDSCDTVLSWTADSYGSRVLPTAIVDGTAIKIDDADISPALAAYEVIVCDDTGAELIRFSNPHNNVSGNYPANSGTTYPLPQGTYYPKLADGSGALLPLPPIKIDAWNLCDKSVTMNYNGLSASGSFNYTLPLAPGETEYDAAFKTLTIPDRFIIRDCAGAVIFDSGQISTSGQSYDWSTVGFDVSCGAVDVEIIPDPSQPPGVVTIYELTLGCCSGIENCEIPQRDPIPIAILDDGCARQVWAAAPMTMNSNAGGVANHIVQNIDPLTASGGCIGRFNDVPYLSLRAGFGCNQESLKGLSGCRNFVLAQERTIQKNGDVISFTMNSQAAYDRAAAFLQEMASEIASISSTGFGTFQPLSGFNVLCGSDGNTVPSPLVTFGPSLVTYDPASLTITVDYSSIAGQELIEGECCSAIRQDVCNAFRYFLDIGLAQTNLVFIRGTNIETGVGTLSADGLFYEQTLPWGISSTCENYNSVRNYTLRQSVSSSYWELLNENGVVIADSNSPIVPGVTQSGALTNSVSQALGVVNQNGLLIQDQVESGPFFDYATCTLDLTYYGGGSAESFSDGQAVADRLAVLTGVAFTYIPRYMIFRPSPLSSGWVHLIANCP